MIFGYLLLGGFAALILVSIYVANYRANNKEEVEAIEKELEESKTNDKL